MKITRHSIYYGLVLAAVAVGLFEIASFFVSDATKYDLRTVDWDGIGAVMSGIGALATIAAAWAATAASRAALQLTQAAADERRHHRNRRALAAQLQIQNELDIVMSRLDEALKIVSNERSLASFRRSVDQMRKTRIDVVNRCLVEADTFEPLFAVQLSFVSAADRKLKEIFGSNEEDGQVMRIEAIDLYCSLASNYRDAAKVARDEARKSFGWAEYPG
jgi:hypothetical protein